MPVPRLSACDRGGDLAPAVRKDRMVPAIAITENDGMTIIPPSGAGREHHAAVTRGGNPASVAT
ncbi:MAG: hypothetical protein ACREPF_07950, partial [Rhodanobacteraceae bacterium]